MFGDKTVDWFNGENAREKLTYPVEFRGLVGPVELIGLRWDPSCPRASSASSFPLMIDGRL